MSASLSAARSLTARSVDCSRHRYHRSVIGSFRATPVLIRMTIPMVIAPNVTNLVFLPLKISFSNSLIESWWRVLKHQWLYLNSLDSVSTVRRLVNFYVAEHNTRLPHSAFRGQTPDEMYFGTGSQVPKALEEARAAARRTRLMLNRTASCSVCRA